jgi:hypothetical protein
VSVRRLILAAGVVAASAAVMPAAAPAATRESFKQMFFSVKSSKGYAVTVSGNAGASVVFVQATRRSGTTRQIVQYTAPGTVKTTALKANLGALGKIDVDFEPRKTQVIKEKTCTAKRRAALTRGMWKGTIKLNGELGYTKLNARRATGTIISYPKATCKDVQIEHIPTVIMSATNYGVGDSLSLNVVKTGSRKPQFGAAIQSSSGAVSIVRNVLTTSGSFSYASDFSTASVTVDGGPFAGSGTYVHDPEAGETGPFTGDLSVAFPGLSGRYQLTGPDAGGSLTRY